MTSRHRGVIIAAAALALAALATTAAATLAPLGDTTPASSPSASQTSAQPAPVPADANGVAVDARGRVTTVSTAPGGGDVLGSFLVEGPKDPTLVCDKAWLTVTGDTRFFRRTSEGDVPLDAVSMALLEPGMRVEVTITGPVAESYPVQATAATVTIVG